MIENLWMRDSRLVQIVIKGTSENAKEESKSASDKQRPKTLVLQLFNYVRKNGRRNYPTNLSHAFHLMYLEYWCCSCCILRSAWVPRIRLLYRSVNIKWSLYKQMVTFSRTGFASLSTSATG